MTATHLRLAAWLADRHNDDYPGASTAEDPPANLGLDDTDDEAVHRLDRDRVES